VITLTIHVQPRASKTEVAGRYGDAIRIRLKAPPVDGAANEELITFLAQRLGVARSAVRVRSGATGRRKRVQIADGALTPANLERRLGLT
jgi:uncharacterized protein (TIGR00251 family)